MWYFGFLLQNRKQRICIFKHNDCLCPAGAAEAFPDPVEDGNISDDEEEEGEAKDKKKQLKKKKKKKKKVIMWWLMMDLRTSTSPRTGGWGPLL